jgi:hypothetical protein
MSTALAIAAVTALIKEKLEERLAANGISEVIGGSVTVSAVAPDLIKGEGNSEPRVNIFLYQVTPNAAWRNRELPAHDAGGERTSNPPLALELHYLLTAYAKEDMHAEVLLGQVAQLLHELPVFSRALLAKAQEAWAEKPEQLYKKLAAADLAGQFDGIRTTPQPLSVEEISKLWSALQVSYRPSSAYQVSVVLIESQRPARSALPVQARRVRVLPMDLPYIDAVEPQTAEAGSTISILGRNLKGEVVSVRFGSIAVTPEPDRTSYARISLELPAGLRCGVNTVQVRHDIDISPDAPPPVVRPGFVSNIGAFVLRPEATAAVVPGEIEEVTENGVVWRKGPVHCGFTPRVGRRQRVVLLLNELTSVPGATAKAFSFNAPQDNGITAPGVEDTATIDIPFKIRKTAAGTYLARVRVDDAESELTADSEGKYDGPSVTL